MATFSNLSATEFSMHGMPSQAPRDTLKRNQFGGTIGGPVVIQRSATRGIPDRGIQPYQQLPGGYRIEPNRCSASGFNLHEQHVRSDNCGARPATHAIRFEVFLLMEDRERTTKST